MEIGRMDEKFQYSIDISGDTAYVTPIGYASMYSYLQKDSDFVGTKDECINYLKQRGINVLFGSFNATRH